MGLEKYCSKRIQQEQSTPYLLDTLTYISYEEMVLYSMLHIKFFPRDYIYILFYTFRFHFQQNILIDNKVCKCHFVTKSMYTQMTLKHVTVGFVYTQNTAHAFVILPLP
jgi:hypothetical protein